MWANNFFLERDQRAAQFNMIRSIAKSFVELFSGQFHGKRLSQYLILRALTLLIFSLPSDTNPLMTIAAPNRLHQTPESSQQEAATGRFILRTSSENIRGRSGSSPIRPLPRFDDCLLLKNRFCPSSAKAGLCITACGSLEGIQRISSHGSIFNLVLFAEHCHCRPV